MSIIKFIDDRIKKLFYEFKESKVRGEKNEKSDVFSKLINSFYFLFYKSEGLKTSKKIFLYDYERKNQGDLSESGERKEG